MAAKILSLYFVLYLLVSGSSLFSCEDFLYGLKTQAAKSNEKVCLIIIDGLRYDSVPFMEFLGREFKNNHAVLYKSISGMPSCSRPGYERILTGAESSINGVESNRRNILSLTPNLFYLCRLNGLTTASSCFYWFYELYPFQIDHDFYYYIDDSPTFNRASQFIKHYNPDFIVVHPMSVDNAGHKYGGKSPQYLNEVKKVDKEVSRIWDEIKNRGYTLIVTSDHGHRDEGGHGDDCSECIDTPLIVISLKLNELKLKSNSACVRQTDIAPTICDMLGISKTIYMTGESLLENNMEIGKIRTIFSTGRVKNFKSFFNITSVITYFIMSLYTAINFGCFFVIIIILKQ